LTELDDAIMARIREIVFTEHRPFCYKDFETFVINGKTYHVAHGTFRNKISKLLKDGKIELEFNSKICFYTLKGIHFGNRMTRNHMGIPSVIPVTGCMRSSMEELLDYLKTIPIEQASVHDIHYKFTVPDIYTIFASSLKYKHSINPVSKDILLTPDIIDGLKITTIIHRTDTVTVTIACSKTPLPINEAGILTASCALTRVEERLSSKLDECGNTLPGGYERIPIPDNRRWTVTMWHFGKDRKFEYKNGFSLTWGYGRLVLRSYTKAINNGKVVRDEKQEYPNKTHQDAFKVKIR
jgi:hypothetical protein